jgi:hypothetical protein
MSDKHESARGGEGGAQDRASYASAAMRALSQAAAAQGGTLPAFRAALQVAADTFRA